MHYKVSLNLLQNSCWCPHKLQTWAFESWRAGSSHLFPRAGSRGKLTARQEVLDHNYPNPLHSIGEAGAQGQGDSWHLVLEGLIPLCASRSELFGVLKLTGNTMDTLQFLGETLWDTLKTLLCRMWVQLDHSVPLV